MPTPKRARRRKAKPPCSAYEGYESAEERLLARIVNAPFARRSWNKGGKGRKPQRLSDEDLACGLWAVECVGEKGISYGQLDRCFKDSRGVGCHLNKASAIFSTLLAMNLIAKVGNYSVGRRGNIYAVWHEGQPKPQPNPQPTRALESVKEKPLDFDESPW